MGDFYGIKGLKLIDHGQWNDPEIEYRGYRVNYFAVEDPLFEVYKEVQFSLGEPVTGEGFEKWVPTQKDEVLELVKMEIEAKARKSIKKSVESIEGLIDSINILINSPDRMNTMDVDCAVHDLDEIAAHLGRETFDLCMVLYEDDVE